MKFSIFQDTRRGARDSNEDRVAYCYSRDALLLLVADGMGGHLNGEVAAQVAARFITEAFRREARPALADPWQFLRRSFAGAHGAIVANAASADLPQTPLTTCVVCVVQDHAACWAHAGDSRLYHVRDGEILAQTKDHSRVQQLIDQGRMREEAYPAHPERNRIFSCLGSRAAPQIDFSDKTPLRAGDSLILCSDGLWGPLSSKIIGSALKKRGIMEAIPELADEAERRAGPDCDNLSVVAMTLEKD
jgi:serine/threonine protein phosphatase PrpC